ncbi:MAG TPA: L,D-transpeptidase [Methylocystis sp.]|nr:L,D-transpeptidase [Methylocystis sp.]
MSSYRTVGSTALLALALSGAGGASAAQHWNSPEAQEQAAAYAASEPAPRDDYGGGFIEFLVTGSDPAYRAAPAQAPQAPQGYRASVGGVEPQALRREIDPIYRRTEVEYAGGAPGTVVIDTTSKFLYYVERGGRAIRYGVGVGRPGFEWLGVKTISRKTEWPDWTPPKQMLARRPDLPRFMAGGLENPLGARALYLGSSLYRIHGTNEPWTIGQNVSSGCIRMMNEDVKDLYARVNVGTKVIVR